MCWGEQERGRLRHQAPPTIKPTLRHAPHFSQTNSAPSLRHCQLPFRPSTANPILPVTSAQLSWQLRFPSCLARLPLLPLAHNHPSHPCAHPTHPACLTRPLPACPLSLLHAPWVGMCTLGGYVPACPLSWVLMQWYGCRLTSCSLTGIYQQ